MTHDRDAADARRITWRVELDQIVIAAVAVALLWWFS